jgi:hypothetical protein
VEQQELAKRLHEAMGNSDVQTLLDLIRLLRANVLEEMATCEESRFRENQGRIQAYDKLEQMITRPPLRM